MDIEKVIKGLRCIKGDTILCRECDYADADGYGNYSCKINCAIDAIALLKEQETDKNKYEYKYDHTDCLWYGSGNCPSTCSQYRDGWNDAMDYIFKDGKGYQPYRRR